MTKESPLVSIIIVNWNGEDVLPDLLRFLKKLTYKNFEIIFVDNGSTDGSLDIVAKLKIVNCKLKIMRNKRNVGFALANNQALKGAKGKYILLLNNDTKVTPNFLTPLVLRAEKNPKIAVIQPKILMMDKTGLLDNAGGFLTKIGFLEHRGFGEKDSKEFNLETNIFTAKGACMLIRKSMVNQIGLFDTDFVSYFEETDFCWRVWLMGYKVLYFPKAIIYHKVGFTIKRLDVGNINFHYYKNRITSLLKNLEVKNLVIILPLHVIISLGIASAFLLRGQFKSFWMILRAILWNISNFDKTLTKRNIIQKNRKVTDKEIFAKFMHPVNWQKFWGDFKRVEADIKTQSSQR